MTPAEEQQAIIGAYRTGRSLVIKAGAGTGKTTTLKMLGAERPGRKGVYVAYNKAIAQDAKRTFPAGVQCATRTASPTGRSGACSGTASTGRVFPRRRPRESLRGG